MTGEMLFESGALQQDTGLLSERWGQEGSVLFNVTANVSVDDVLMFTIPSNMVGYVTDILVSNSDNDSGTYNLTDGSGGTRKFRQTTTTVLGAQANNYFKTPIEFEDSIYLQVVSGLDINITISGWVE